MKSSREMSPTTAAPHRSASFISPFLSSLLSSDFSAFAAFVVAFSVFSAFVAFFVVASSSSSYRSNTPPSLSSNEDG